MQNVQESTWKRNVMVAVTKGDSELLDQLLGFENRPTLDFAFRGYTPLTWAVDDENYAIVEQLLHAGASADFYEGSNRGSPVVVAIRSQNVRIFNLLLSYGADVKRISDQALTWAVLLGSDKFVRLLLAHGAQPDSWISGSWDNFTFAVDWTRRDMLKRFLIHFISHFSEREVQLPLHLLTIRAIKESSEDCAIMFLEEGIYPQSNLPQTSSLFHIAAEKGQRKVMNLLAELNPQFLQEEWLIQKKVPMELCKYKSYISWLIEYRKQVPSLQKLCKSSILSQLGSYYKPKIPQLPLPKSLKKYLSSRVGI